MELRKENYETYHGTVSGEAGNKTLFSGTLTPVGSNPAPVVSAAVVPPASPDALPLPRASIKIDGKFDDWKDVPPVVVGSQDATDNMTISKVYLAADAKNFYIRLDIADKTPVSFLHPYNFRKTDDVLSYGITMESGDGRRSATVRLIYADPSNPFKGWLVLIGVFEKSSFTSPFGRSYLSGSQGDVAMKGSSAEIAVPLDRIKRLLPDFGKTRRYRITGWTANSPQQEGNLEDLRETEPGYSTF